MFYKTYELQQKLTAPVRDGWDRLDRTIGALPPPFAANPASRRVRAACQILTAAHPTHERPDWGITSVDIDAQSHGVVATEAWWTPFASLTHFAKPTVGGHPPVLVVGPISGHFATLLRPTVRTLLADHDVHVLDWHNARDIPLADGPFGLDEYIDHVLQAITHLGPDVHVLAVCQPAPLVLAAVAALAADDGAATPSSLTLIAGPVDTRVNPSRINELAQRRPLSFYQRLLTRVPRSHRGAGRRVYPGVLQLGAFMSMNSRRHISSHYRLYRALVAQDVTSAGRIRDFYDEYGAVMDVPAEFYLETLQRVFMRHDLAVGTFDHRGRTVDPALITRTALLTVEGAEDDMCPPGQTQAAHQLCAGIPPERKQHHLQAGAGHYGVFAGSRWEQEIYPVIRQFIAAHRAPRLASVRP